jgi:hypothetical protein
MSPAERLLGRIVCAAWWPACAFIEWRYTAYLKREGLWGDDE